MHTQSSVNPHPPFLSSLTAPVLLMLALPPPMRNLAAARVSSRELVRLRVVQMGIENAQSYRTWTSANRRQTPARFDSKDFHIDQILTSQSAVELTQIWFRRAKRVKTVSVFSIQTLGERAPMSYGFQTYSDAHLVATLE